MKIFFFSTFIFIQNIIYASYNQEDYLYSEKLIDRIKNYSKESIYLAEESNFNDIFEFLNNPIKDAFVKTPNEHGDYFSKSFLINTSLYIISVFIDKNNKKQFFLIAKYLDSKSKKEMLTLLIGYHNDQLYLYQSKSLITGEFLLSDPVELHRDQDLMKVISAPIIFTSKNKDNWPTYFRTFSSSRKIAVGKRPLFQTLASLFSLNKTTTEAALKEEVEKHLKEIIASFESDTSSFSNVSFLLGTTIAIYSAAYSLRSKISFLFQKKSLSTPQPPPYKLAEKPSYDAPTLQHFKSNPFLGSMNEELEVGIMGATLPSSLLLEKEETTLFPLIEIQDLISGKGITYLEFDDGSLNQRLQNTLDEIRCYDIRNKKTYSSSQNLYSIQGIILLLENLKDLSVSLSHTQSEEEERLKKLVDLVIKKAIENKLISPLSF